MMIMSVSKKNAMTYVNTRIALDGLAKNKRATSKLPVVRVVYEKSKNPDPRELNFGLVTS
jgi:hypothetical protein